MTGDGRGAASAAELAFVGGKVVCPDRNTEALLVRGDTIAAVGTDAEIRQAMAPQARVIDLRGRTMVPGFIDGHAHMDREGLKAVLPSLAGAQSIDDILDIIAGLAARTPRGEWIVTMPVGEPPSYEDVPGRLKEQRFPNRWDLDRVAPHHPVYIRSIWGYWRASLPLVSIANSEALRRAGIDARTMPPAPSVEIGRDPATGEPNGIFSETNKMPVVEHTLMRCAPNFTQTQRAAALIDSMRIYNSVGTTGVFEGHGVAGDVVRAYQQARDSGRQTVRATLSFSPVWRSDESEDCIALLRSWGQWLAGRGLGDDWLRMQGMFCEADDSCERQLRSQAFPQTGWAGFHYEASVPRDLLLPLLAEAARNRIQMVGIWPDTLQTFSEVNKLASIEGQRWVVGHLSHLTPDEVKRAADLGVVVTTHTSAYLYKGARLGTERVRDLVPLRSLLDAGVPVSFGSDNVPPSLFHSIWHAVSRTEKGGAKLAPEQAISRVEALRCASLSGAHLSFDEARRGSLEAGKLADLAVLSDDVLTCAEESIPAITADMTVVGGRVVHERAAP